MSETEDRQIHELLPWYANETLEPAEAARFAEHLPACDACQSELLVLERIRDGVRSGGEAYFDRDAGSATRPPSRPAVAARSWTAAAVLGLVALLAGFAGGLLLDRSAASSTGVGLPVVVEAEHRQGGEIAVVPAGADSFQLVFPLDVPRDGFPLSLGIVDETGAMVYTESDVLRQERGLLLLNGERRDFPPGTFIAEVRSEDGRSGPWV